MNVSIRIKGYEIPQTTTKETAEVMGGYMKYGVLKYIGSKVDYLEALTRLIDLLKLNSDNHYVVTQLSVLRYRLEEHLQLDAPDIECW